MTVRLTIAREYHRDARHLLRRFRLLPPQEFDKMGRVKNVVDLCMAAECGLKAHVFAGRSDESAVAIYRKIRRGGGHNLAALVEMADYLADRAIYAAVGQRFANFSVSLRYSLDAWDTFFPFGLAPNDAADQYDQTIANVDWIRAAQEEIQALVESLLPALEGVVEGLNIKQVIEHQEAMKAFLKEAGIGSR
jgi:hypothetical protein